MGEQENKDTLQVLTTNRVFVFSNELEPTDEIFEFYMKLEEMSVQLDHDISEAVSEHFWELL